MCFASSIESTYDHELRSIRTMNEGWLWCSLAGFRCNRYVKLLSTKRQQIIRGKIKS